MERYAKLLHHIHERRWMWERERRGSAPCVTGKRAMGISFGLAPLAAFDAVVMSTGIMQRRAADARVKRFLLRDGWFGKGRHWRREEPHGGPQAARQDTTEPAFDLSAVLSKGGCWCL